MTVDRALLPSNARRWLDRSLPVDAPLPQRILNTQQGEMDIRGTWSPFMADTLYRVQPYTFTWKARFKLFPGVWLVAEDGHDGEQGWGGAKLWGIVPMGGRNGPEVLAMQWVRDLAELPWKPQFALAVPAWEWHDAGQTSFTVRAVRGSYDVSVTFELSSDGDIVRASGQRYYDVPEGFVQAPWHYDFSDHREYNGIRVPASAAATYEKPDGPWPYWRGRILSLVADP